MSINPAILASTDYAPSVAGTALPSTFIGSALATAGSPLTDDPPPPQPGWPDPFMSYTRSGGIVLDGVNGGTISYKSFEDITRASSPRWPIMLNNCSNIVIERIDTRACDMGLLYAQNVSNITVRYCRAENIGYSRIGQVLGDGWINENDFNVFQFNGADGLVIEDIKARYANNEDAFSFYDVTNSTATRIEYEGCVTTTRPTSDGRPSTYWTSGSGTAFILGDSPGTGGHDLTVTNSTFIDPGQVGLAIACGYNNTFDNCVSISTGNPPIGAGVNVGCYISPQASGCTICVDNAITNSQVDWVNGNGSFIECASSNVAGSNFSASLNVEDYRVTL